MRFIVDARLPPALARWLDAKGHQASHVGDFGMQAASDRAIWDRAEISFSVLVTKDEDFAHRRKASDEGPAVIWIRLPNTRRQDSLKWFESKLPGVLEMLMRGETLIELR